MGKWTLAHTEELCNEKFQQALQKPLRDAGLKLEEFFEGFDPQDPVVQRIVGALVNDVSRRKTCNKGCGAGRVHARINEAVLYLNNVPGDPISVSSRYARSIRARRQRETAWVPPESQPIEPTIYPAPYVVAPPDDLSDYNSSMASNLYDAYTPTVIPPVETGDDGPHQLDDSPTSWWRADGGRSISPDESRHDGPSVVIRSVSPSPVPPSSATTRGSNRPVNPTRIRSRYREGLWRVGGIWLPSSSARTDGHVNPHADPDSNIPPTPSEVFPPSPSATSSVPPSSFHMTAPRIPLRASSTLQDLNPIPHSFLHPDANASHFRRSPSPLPMPVVTAPHPFSLDDRLWS